MSSSSRKYCVVAAGRAFTDVIAHVPQGFIESHEIPVDAGREFDSQKLLALRSSLSNPQIAPGGTGANAVSIVAALGGKAGFFAKVGLDDIGTFFLKDFEKRGVDLCCEPHVEGGEPSAVCLVLLTEDGKRSFATNHGCADDYSADDFRNFDFFSTDFFMIDAELLTRSHAAPLIREVIDSAKDKTRIVINIHNVRSWPDTGDVTQFIAEKADVIIGNHTEFDSFERVQSVPISPHQIVVTTCGTEGVVAKVGDLTLHLPAVTPPKFVSSVGAGDAFLAGFLFAISKDLDMMNCLRYGIHAAVAILGEVGARPTQPLNIEIEKGMSTCSN